MWESTRSRWMFGIIFFHLIFQLLVIRHGIETTLHFFNNLISLQHMLGLVHTQTGQLPFVNNILVVWPLALLHCISHIELWQVYINDAIPVSTPCCEVARRRGRYYSLPWCSWIIEASPHLRDENMSQTQWIQSLYATHVQSQAANQSSHKGLGRDALTLKDTF